jgi:hypothetical protein
MRERQCDRAKHVARTFFRGSLGCGATHLEHPGDSGFHRDVSLYRASAALELDRSELFRGGAHLWARYPGHIARDELRSRLVEATGVIGQGKRQVPIFSCPVIGGVQWNLLSATNNVENHLSNMDIKARTVFLIRQVNVIEI